MEISIIYDFSKLEKEGNLPVVCKLPDGKEIPLTRQLYVADGEANFILARDEVNYEPTKLFGLFNSIDYERQDDCWDGYKEDDLFEGSNEFYDCGVSIIEDYESETSYMISDVEINEKQITFVLQ